MAILGLRKGHQRILLAGIILVLIASVMLLNANQHHSTARATGLRNKHQQPFSWYSIWNMPIGKNARYKKAGFQPARHTGFDVDHYIVTTEADPIVPWYSIGKWKVGRCTGTRRNGYIRVPHALVVPDSTQSSTPNNAAAFLQPDGKTLIQMNPLARCKAGGPVYGYSTPGQPRSFESIYGMGITGGHGGSGLSSIGGTIRLGELLPSAGAIRHVLKVNVFAHRYLYRYPPGYRGPAIRADAAAYKADSPLRYSGDNPNLVMGALLAIPPEVREDTLDLRTEPARKLFHALQDYGAYIADDTAWDAYAITIEKGVDTEFEQAYGYSFGAYSGDLHNDVNQLFSALKVVVNNRPTSIGGGGQPRQQIAPPIYN